MEEMRQRQAAFPIDRSERSQSYSMPGERPGDGTPPLQEPATPQFRKGAPPSFVRRTQLLPISTPPAMLEVNQVLPS